MTILPKTLSFQGNFKLILTSAESWGKKVIRNLSSNFTDPIWPFVGKLTMVYIR